MRNICNIMLVLCFIASVYSQEIVPEEEKSFAAGALFNTEGAGLEADFFFNPGTGIRFAAMYISGLGLNDGEYIITAVVALQYMFNEGDIFQPVIFAGPSYSYQRWISQNRENSGNFHDLTAGGGGGIVLNLPEDVMIGFNLWINYDYKTDDYGDHKQKGDRFLLFFPFIDIRMAF